MMERIIDLLYGLYHRKDRLKKLESLLKKRDEIYLKKIQQTGYFRTIVRKEDERLIENMEKKTATNNV